MSAASIAAPQPRPARLSNRFPIAVAGAASGSKCAKCGSTTHQRGASRDTTTERWPDDAQRRIDDLESQVRILSDKASTAADKLADYEDELVRLKSEQAARPSAPANAAEPATPSDPRPSTATSMTSRLGNLLGTNKSVTQLSPARTPSPTPEGHVRRESDLEAALATERERREKAEGQVSKISNEVEELSATLFQQANEMVATERKARAKLEERIEVLERRDGEKQKRLERLEGAMQRIERVRKLLEVP